MKKIELTAFELAQRFVGIKELPGDRDTPFIMAMLQLDVSWPQHDEVAWCSAFVNFISHLLRLPRSKSLAARSNLQVGRAIDLSEATVGFDVVILKRGDGVQPGPEVIQAPGHVGFFGGLQGDRVQVLAGNQGNAVSLAPFPVSQVLGVRRLFE